MTREEFDARNAAWDQEYEYLTVSRRLDRLYAARSAGDTTVYLAQRIDRTERLLQAMLGFPEQLAG
ncbi:hypothetical protein [Streptomyces chartreusis]|uniref:hypothetical protein n=1 Tax=Streptomyces chartreusis TaxID=1969 RepID=UPI00123D5F39|nr:hypothetical protein [Streptomyces chartreusis]QEV70259.1 hypothetical protein CP983_28865 [Streptomyces chartreusis]GGX12643.1 hypothetical protein GCM10010321_28930 [Streptomyces chartreusis]